MGLQQSLRGIDGDVGEIVPLAHAPALAHDRSMKAYFDHEKLDVYQESVAFCGWVGDLLNDITGKAAAKDQLERIVNMLMGMLKRFSGRAEFLREDEGAYPNEYDHDHEQDHDHVR